ncbi:MAG: uroporphyrinogen decarboxylase family protein [Acidobacteriota bacterium]
MNSFERVITTLEHRAPDCIPLDLGSSLVTGITRQAYLSLCAALSEDPGRVQLYDVVQQLPVVKESILQRLGVDIRGVVPNVVRKNPELKRDGDGFVFSDEFGVTFRKPDDATYFSIIDTKLAGAEKTVEDIEDFEWPDPQALRLFEGIVEQARNYCEGGYPVLLDSFGAGIFEMSCRVRGVEQFYMDLALNAELACALMDKFVEMKIRFYEAAAELLGKYVQFIRESDDLAGQEALLVSPRMYRELIKPRHKKLFDAQKQLFPKPFYCFLHSDGALMEILPDLIDCGVEILNPVQLSAAGVDATVLKADFGERLSFWGGGVDTQHTLPHATPDQVRQAVTESIEKLCPGGGYIFGAVHNIQDDVPAENILAMLDAFYARREYR